MKKYVFLMMIALSNSIYSQSNGLTQKLFNYSLSYGPRGNSSFYSVGYEFSEYNSNVNIGVGYGKIMAELNLFNPNTFSINGIPNESYVGLNYVYRNKDYKWLILNTGFGYSLNGDDKLIFKIGTNFRISHPLYITTTLYQTDRTRFMIGGRLYIF